jgi:hypothetical protein
MKEVAKRTYHCSGQVAWHASVRASSVQEATRIIDDAIEAADVVIFFEEDGDELVADKGQASRSHIQLEQ